MIRLKISRIIFISERRKDENIYISAESESGVKAVAVEHKGFSDNMYRTDIIGGDINSSMVVYTVRNNGDVCVFVYTHGGNNDNGLYILCV